MFEWEDPKPETFYGCGYIEYVGGPFDGEIADTTSWSRQQNLRCHVREGHTYRGVTDGTHWWFVYDSAV